MEIDRTLLAKLLSMTDSAHDAEALAAIRKANQLLRFQSATWSDVLETSASSDVSPTADDLPPGYQHTGQYRDTFRRETIVLRLFAFPFWIFVEILTAIAPNRVLDTRGRALSLMFTLCMLLSVAAWVGLGYYLVFELD
ncbi:MAG: hypothetical protein PSV46_26070 [Reyranella sp.]|nr:hypothetical protein [Reyranella sp.]